jgi:uncharacterized protein YdhG (YjbR/CyaY superfamily)
MIKARNVDEYIALSPKEAHSVLLELRQIILNTIPKVEESISWNVPFYKYFGQLAGFATYKNHVSFGIAVGVLEASDRKELEKKGYKTGNKTMQIAFDQKVPSTIIKRILKEKAKLNKDKKSKK